MNPARRATLLGLGAVLLWSTVAAAFKLSLAHQTPAQLLLYSSASARLILGLMTAARGALAARTRSFTEKRSGKREASPCAAEVAGFHWASLGGLGMHSVSC